MTGHPLDVTAPLTGRDPQADPEFTGCRTCGHEDCPGGYPSAGWGNPATACPSARIEQARERAVLEHNVADKDRELERLRAKVRQLDAVVVDLQERCAFERERAEQAEGALRAWEIEHETLLRYEREATA